MHFAFYILIIVAIWIIAVAFCIAQISIIRSLAICQVTPDIVLIITIYTAFFHKRKAVLIGFATGIFLDLYNQNLGLNALTGTIIGYTAEVLSSKIYKELPIMWIIAIFSYAILLGVVRAFAEHQMGVYFFARYTIPAALYSTIAGLIIIYTLSKIIPNSVSG